MRKLLTHPVTFKVVIGLYVACIFALIATYFGVSTLDVQVSMYLQAPSELVAGKPTAARGIVINAPTGKLFVDANTRFRIGKTEIGEAETASHGHLHVQLAPPATLKGEQQLEIEVEHPAIEDFAIDVPVIVGDERPFTWPEPTTRQVDEKQRSKLEWEGDLRVSLIPVDNEVPRGLPTVIYLLLHDEAGTPVPGVIAVKKIEGMLEGDAPVELITDDLGLVRVPVTAVTSQKWTLEATEGRPEEGVEPRTGSGAIRLITVASQFSVVPKQLVAIPGQPVEAFVHTLHRSGGIMVDLYDGHRWVFADAFGINPQGAGLRAFVPEKPESELVRVQVYQDLFEAGSAWDSRWLVVGSAGTPQACAAQLRKVLELHRGQTGIVADWARQILDADLLAGTTVKGCDRKLEAALLAVPHHFEPAPLLVNTQLGDRKELDEWRKEVQGQLVVATGAVLLVGFLFILLLVLRGMQRSQRHAQLIREVELETATDEELETPQSINIERWLIVLQTVIMVLTIFTFGASLIMLLRLM